MMAKPTSANDPMIGTWKLNVSKSNFTPGPAPKSAISKFEPWEDGIKATIDLVDGQGNRVHLEVAARFDGKDYPIKGSPIADAISLKRVNERQTDVIEKKDGKVVMTAQSVISADGMTETVTQTGKDAKGRAYEDSVPSNLVDQVTRLTPASRL